MQFYRCLCCNAYSINEGRNFIKISLKLHQKQRKSEKRTEKPRKPDNGQWQPQHCLCYLPKRVAHPLGSPVACTICWSDNQPVKLATRLLLLFIGWTRLTALYNEIWGINSLPKIALITC